MRRGWVWRFALLTLMLACTPIAQTRVAPLDPIVAAPAAANDAMTPAEPELAAPSSEPRIAAAPADPLSCTERVAIPQIDNAFDARWSDDSNSIAVSRIVTIPNARTITGTEEEQRLSLVNVAKGVARDVGQGSKPAWSGGGIYLSYWREGSDDLRVVLGDRVAALVPSTQPDARWVGDELYFFNDAEIRVWKNGQTWTVANVVAELAPKYPRDDVYFSADGQRFTMTRYFSNGNVERYLGTTSTGAMEPFGDGNTLFTQWAPVGHALLVRSASAVTLLSEGGTATSSPAAALAGRVHAWTGDGRLMFGTLSATLPSASAFDKFAIFGDEAAVASLPNLLGVRSFSPDGRYFMGVTRTGLYSTQLEVYRCGTPSAAHADPRADTVARARAATIDADPRRFVRPVSGAISQYLQGNHTGVDVAAPVGSILVAADGGIVNEVGWVPVGGRRVCVLHQGGLESCDYHTSLPLVSIGDRVVRGQPVALVGMTGLTYGPHVHWEAKLNGMIVDPLAQ
jgi:murein DD-endopeptidase MepM/ murein hydrolase activator NlpD